MKILALDTSNHPMSVALVEDEQLKATTTLNTVRNHSIYVLPTIDDLMQKVAWQPQDLDRIVVAKGPGSYTGIRIAVTLAKTLAKTLNCPLVGISSLAAIAAGLPAVTPGLMVPFFDARRGFVFAGQYAYQAGQLTAQAADQHWAWADLLASLPTDRPVYLLGALTPKLRQAAPTLPANVTVLPDAAMVSTFALAKLGAQATPVADVDAFVPDYLRITEAEANWQKTHPGQVSADYVQEV